MGKQPKKRNISFTQITPNIPRFNPGDTFVRAKDKVSFEIFKACNIASESISGRSILITPTQVTTFENVTYPSGIVASFYPLEKTAYEKVLKLYHIFYASVNAISSKIINDNTN